MTDLANLPELSQETLDDLIKYDTPTVCNVVELWDLRPRNTGYMDGRIKACFPKMPPIVGYALTSTFRSMAPPRGGDVYAGMGQQIDAMADLPGQPIIVYQDIDDPVAAATFGEVMCSTYQAFGAKGIITSGGGRDLDQVEAIGFPAFTDGTICAHGFCHTLSVNVPVTVGGMAVYPGDLMHADRNGVTSIPHEIASEVAPACEELMGAEQIVLDYLQGGNLSSAGFNEARAACSDRVAQLQKRLKG
jgi:4-hydroxy-4-methyl-2-oxoglutarate aldolase